MKSPDEWCRQLQSRSSEESSGLGRSGWVFEGAGQEVGCEQWVEVRQAVVEGGNEVRMLRVDRACVYI